MEPFKVALAIPPQWTAAQPSMAAASLNGHLRRAGFSPTTWDLNAEFLHYVTSPSTLRLSLHRLHSALHGLPLELGLRIGTGDSSIGADAAAARLSAIQGYLQDVTRAGLEDLVSGAAYAVAALADADAYFDPVRYMDAQLTVDRALKLFSLPFHPCEVKWNDFAHPHVPYNLQPLLELVDSRTDNPFRVFFQDWVGTLLDDGPDAVFVSIIAFSQVVPGLTLARMVREAVAERGMNTHVSLGGNFFSRLREKMVNHAEFFRCFADSLVFGEGEKPAVALCRALALDTPLESVPSLAWLEGDKVRATPEAPNFRMDEMAFQDLEGMRLERYLAPERVLCVRASKGCYYGECTFCDSHHGLQSDTAQVERLVAELQYLGRVHGIRHFEFVDQCIAPSYMRQMCEAFIKADLDVRWFCNARTETGFTPDLLRLMRRAGATMVMWGVETASPRLLKLMRKGVSPTGRMDVLRAASDAGLFNFAYIFFGFPTETEEEAQATIDLVCANTDIIHAYGRSVFTLGKHSPLMKDPRHYGVLAIVEDDQEFSTNLSHKATEDMGPGRLSAILQRCLDQCHAAYGGPLWMSLRSREALHLYLARHGREFVQAYRFPVVEPGDQQPEFTF